MIKLIKNELIKIFKRKNIYILFIIAILVMIGFNIYGKYRNIDEDIQVQYEKAYKQDNFYLDNYEILTNEEKYEDILERVQLEKYAIENNIKYNILLNTQNKNTQLPTDARIELMKVFNNFDIITIFIIIYLASTIISEEFSSGTIKNLLVKPYKRISILTSKIITSILVTLIVAIAIIVFQYMLGGLLFGFDSYSLEAIRYNHITQQIETMSLSNYMILMFFSKVPMYIILTIFSLLLGTITNNMAINILFSLGLYLISSEGILFNNISKYLFIYNWDISKYLFGGMSGVGIIQPMLISGFSILFIIIALTYIFKNKDVVSE